MGELLDGQWISFADANGKGYAQPDFLLIGPDEVLIIEVKLKQNSSAHPQLDKLYRPLVQYLWPHCRVRMLQVFKYPRFEIDDRRIAQLEDIFDKPTERIYELHWLG